MSFWQNIPKPIIGMSPMDGVTDFAFRQTLSLIAKPSVVFTEFVHVMAIWHGKLNVFDALKFDNIQRPIVAQIFGSQPEYFYKAAHVICELGFDGIDINMGCPANTIVRRGGGAQLIQNPELALKIVSQTKKGVLDWVNGQSLEKLGLSKAKIHSINQMKKNFSQNKDVLPISIKTRLGIDKNIIDSWSDYLIQASPDAITIHGRTLKQLYHGNADWNSIGLISDKVKKAGIVYLGNGDVQSYHDAIEKIQKFKLDGVLIGRAALGNPWIFDTKSKATHIPPIPIPVKLNVLLQHARIFCQNTNEKQFSALKKHLGWYCEGFVGAKNLRIKLMKCNNYFEVEETILNFSS